jgi:hypothetical protein
MKDAVRSFTSDSSAMKMDDRKECIFRNRMNVCIGTESHRKSGRWKKTHLQHSLNTLVTDLLTRFSDFLGTLNILLVSETRFNKFRSVSNEQVPNGFVAYRGDLD